MSLVNGDERVIQVNHTTVVIYLGTLTNRHLTGLPGPGKSNIMLPLVLLIGFGPVLTLTHDDR